MKPRIVKRTVGVWIVGLTVVACGASQNEPSAPNPTVVTGPATTGPSSGCPGYADPTHCPPFPTGGSNSISGIVTRWTNGAASTASGIRVSGYVFKLDGSGYSMGWVVADTTGRYTVTGVPDGMVVLYAYIEGGSQPCAAIASLRGANATSDIEVVTPGGGKRPGSPTDSPTLSGTVYINTPAGRQPVVGAYVEFEYFPDLVTATTTTDEHGHYTLCRLPKSGSLYVSSGQSPQYFAVTLTGDQVLDVEVKP